MNHSVMAFLRTSDVEELPHPLTSCQSTMLGSNCLYDVMPFLSLCKCCYHIVYSNIPFLEVITIHISDYIRVFLLQSSTTMQGLNSNIKVHRMWDNVPLYWCSFCMEQQQTDDCCMLTQTFNNVDLVTDVDEVKNRTYRNTLIMLVHTNPCCCHLCFVSFKR